MGSLEETEMTTKGTNLILIVLQGSHFRSSCERQSLGACSRFLHLFDKLVYQVEVMQL